MKLYKLTDSEDQTMNQTQWGENITHEVSGKGELCGPGWLHAYTSPLLAVLLNPIHGNFDEKKMHLWEAEGDIGKDDKGLKVGCKKLTTLKRIKVPELTLVERCRFAIMVAKEVYSEPQFNKWADDWLSGKDRSEAAAWAAWAAEAAAWAARAAARAAWAAEAAAWAARAAARAAEAAAWAAEAADGKRNPPLDLIKLAEKAIYGTRKDTDA